MSQTFDELQETVAKELNKDFQQGKMSLVDMMSVLYLLGKTKNEEELIESMKLFADDFVSLKDILTLVSHDERESKHEDIQLILAEMIKNDPQNAADIAKLASTKGLTKAKILQKFPNAKHYFE